MKAESILIATLLLVSGKTAWADHWTKTYIFEGLASSQTEYSGYFYEEGKPSTHYNSSPGSWTDGATGSLSFTLADAVTLTLSSSTSRISVHKDNGLMAQGSATLTLGGGRYFYHVRLFDGNGNVVGFDADGKVVNQAEAVTQADYWGLLQGFTRTFSSGIGIKKIEIFYGNTPYLEDIAPGSGTSSNPYVITNTTQMEAFARSVAASHTFEGQYVTLGADIAYHYDSQWDDNSGADYNYTAIGGFGRPFRGTFDGLGHTVSGIRIYKGGETDDDTNQGLFGYIGSGGMVKCVILRDARIFGFSYIGGIVGYNSGTVTCCYVVNTYVKASSLMNEDIIVGYQDGGTYSRSNYRDCSIWKKGHGVDGMRPNIEEYVNALYALTPGTGVGLTRSGGTVLGTSGVTMYDDGATEGTTQYYIEGASAALTYTGGTVPAGYEVTFTATAGSLNGSTLTMPTDNVEVTASVAPVASYAISAHQATLAGQTRYWTTFYHPAANYLLPAGAQAFFMKNDKALYRLGNGSIIPADCAVMIMAESASVTLTATDASVPSVAGNILHGTSAATTAPAGAHVMSKVSDTFGFFEYSGEIPAGKAYYVE